MRGRVIAPMRICARADCPNFPRVRAQRLTVCPNLQPNKHSRSYLTRTVAYHNIRKLALLNSMCFANPKFDRAGSGRSREPTLFLLHWYLLRDARGILRISLGNRTVIDGLAT